MITLLTYLRWRRESWSYQAKGNLSTVRQFIKELEGCPDVDKRCLADKTLRDKGMSRIPKNNTLKGGKAGVDQGPLRDESAPEHRGRDNRHQASRLWLRPKHWAVQHSEPGVDEESREEWSDDGLGEVHKREHEITDIVPYVRMPPKTTRP